MNMMLLGAYTLSVVLLLLTPGPVVALVTGAIGGLRNRWERHFAPEGRSVEIEQQAHRPATARRI